MKNTPLKKTLAMTAFGALIYAGSASADSLNGSLGVGNGATDVYRVTCSSAANGITDNLKVKLIDLSPKAAPMISVQVIKAGLAKNTTDAVDGNADYSPSIAVKGGNGLYDVRVNKTATGAELYTLVYACLNSANKSTGVAIATLQNQ